MAEARGAWGIDIGQAGLKAIKLRVSEDGEKVRAVAFDYIQHPKILSQPDAIPAELIKQSVETFLGRNKIGRDLIGISVPGQTSLAKFIKLPPVEPSKVPEIVRYEAKQQIPFDLNEVIWDFQSLGGGVEESGFMLDAEVGLFAMKRDLVYEAMRPLTDQKAEIELVQVAPLALYNYLSYDVLKYRLDSGKEPPDAEDYYIVLDMGADNTTLMVSNGRNLWIRNVPIGGNHFTRALTREMKLTFAKAEHLKCNATRAPDPKAVFQAMRPVFNDYVTEIQRSIGYFGSVNRSAKIKQVIGVGNGFKMAGLQKFLQQNLQYEVIKLHDFKGVTGDSVLSDPLFIDNAMTFAVPYGLALQTLKQTRIRTTLLPPEIVTQRVIRRKKPWAVGMSAGLLLAMGLSTFASARVLSSVSEEKWKPGHDAVAALTSTVSSNTSSYEAQKAAHEANKVAIDELTAPLQKREVWLELLKTINDCLPRDEGDAKDETDPTKKRQLHIESLTHKKVEDVGAWFTALTAEGTGLKEVFHLDDQETGPTGLGYIVTLTGHHFYNTNEDFRKNGRSFIENTLRENLRQWTLNASSGDPTPVGQLGISHPVVVFATDTPYLYDPNARPGIPGAGGMGMYGMGGGAMGAGGMGMGGEYDPGNMGMEGMPGGGNYEGGNYDPAGAGMYGGAGGRGPAKKLDPLEGIEEDKDETQMITMTNFVVQFAWVPVQESDRQPNPPTAEGAGDGADTPATDPAADGS
ncbi:MAG: type IV pilus assembly protein PilM [Planctomycetaceae bacterium]